MFHFRLFSDFFMMIKVVKGLKEIFCFYKTALLRGNYRERTVVYVFIGRDYFLLEEKSSLAIFHMPRKEALVISTSLS